MAASARRRIVRRATMHEDDGTQVHSGGIARLLVGHACNREGVATDARPASVDACTSISVAALFGTVHDQEGVAIVPDDVEVLAIGNWHPCEIMDEGEPLTYSCGEWQPEETIEKLPIQSYRLRVTVGEDAWEWNVNVERQSNCHVITEEFHFVVPPL